MPSGRKGEGASEHGVKVLRLTKNERTGCGAQVNRRKGKKYSYFCAIIARTAREMKPLTYESGSFFIGDFKYAIFGIGNLKESYVL